MSTRITTPTPPRRDAFAALAVLLQRWVKVPEPALVAIAAGVGILALC